MSAHPLYIQAHYIGRRNNKRYIEFGRKIFGLSLIVMCLSLLLSLWEVFISSNALNLELEDLNKHSK